MENIFEDVIAEDLTNLREEAKVCVQEAQVFPNKMNPETHTKAYHNWKSKNLSREIILKVARAKKKPKKQKKRKQKKTVHKGTAIELSEDFFQQTLCKSEESGIFKALKQSKTKQTHNL